MLTGTSDSRSRWARRLALVLIVLPLAAHGQDDEPDECLRRPERITVGATGADQFLGQLTPDGQQLYFVSNRNVAGEIFAQGLDSGRAKRAFDEGADVTWPRVSPDGKRLLYLSFRDRAIGQLCVRELPSGDDRRCLDEAGGAVQAEWISASRIALVSRDSVHNDLRVLEVAVGDRLSARPLLERNIASPAISPDGRWLVFVPVERAFERIGAGFAAQAATHLEALRLDRAGTAQPMPLKLDLPGMTGQPAFSHDARFLYVAQFFEDSNRDAVIDAADNALLFRVPFASERDDAPVLAAAAWPEQLTDAALNCQYPAPSAKVLIATCAGKSGLDVYQLPLEGEVAESIAAPRLLEEVDVASSRADQLLLYRQLLGRETEVAKKRRVMVKLVLGHLEVEQFGAAELYVRHLAALPDAIANSLAKPLSALVAHRRDLGQRGRPGSAFEEQARKRFEEMSPQPGDSKGATALKHLVRSEIADALGDKGQAREELESVAVAQLGVPSILDAYFRRADALYRELDDRDALVASCRLLAEHPKLEPDDRLEYARAATRALVRGLPPDEAIQILAKEREKVAPESELAFAIELQTANLAIRNDDPPKEVRQELIKLYERQTRLDRKRAVILDAVRRASVFGADKVIEALAKRYVTDVPKGTAERRRADRLYRRAMQGRGYRHMAQGRLDKAQADFDAVAASTSSVESVVESLAMRLRAGASAAQLREEFEKSNASAPVSTQAVQRFTRAYLLSRELPSLETSEQEAAAYAAMNELRASWQELRNKRAARALMGAILHERFLRTGDVAAAQKANTHYLVALEQVRSNPRYRALILGQLGMLHEQVGNWRIALGYLDEREKLPLLEDEASLAVRMSRARVLLHVDREKDAAAAADLALGLAEKSALLSAFRLLALDRAALYNLAAGRFQRALSLYDRELAQLETASGSAGRNRLVTRLARAAAAMGAGLPQRALDDLAEVDRGLAGPALQATLRWPHTAHEEVLRSYRLISVGLRANASRKLSQLTEVQQALETRRNLFRERLEASDQDGDARAMALIECRLAENARERGDGAAAAKWIGEALKSADGMLGRTGAGVDPDLLDVLWFAAELQSNGVKVPFDVSKRLREAYQKMVDRKDSGLRGYQRWFEVYLTLMAAARDGRSASLVDPLGLPKDPAAAPAIPRPQGAQPDELDPEVAENPEGK